MRYSEKRQNPERDLLGFNQAVTEFLGDFEPGFEVFGFNRGEFSLIDLIEGILAKIGPSKITIATWTAAKADMDTVHQFLERGDITESKWIVDRSFINRQPALCADLRRKFGDDAIRVLRCHAKFVLIEGCGRKVSIQTSANLNKNARIENFTVSDCPKYWDAYLSLVNQVFSMQEAQDGFMEHSHVTETMNKLAPVKKRKGRVIRSPWAGNGA